MERKIFGIRIPKLLPEGLSVFSTRMSFRRRESTPHQNPPSADEMIWNDALSNPITIETLDRGLADLKEGRISVVDDLKEFKEPQGLQDPRRNAPLT